jgi:hypothetical protein
MAENQVDRAHFRFVHGTLDVPESKAEADGPVMRVVSRSRMETPKGVVEGQIASEAYGLGGFSTIRFSGIVDTVLLACVTPIDEEHVDVRFSFSVKKIGNADVTRGVGKALVEDIEKQMNEDRPIWENKCFHAKPLLCEGDGPIALFRRWGAQFYSAQPPAAP